MLLGQAFRVHNLSSLPSSLCLMSVVEDMISLPPARVIMPAARTLSPLEHKSKQILHKSPLVVMFHGLSNRKIVIQLLLLDSYLCRAFSVNALSFLPH